MVNQVIAINAREEHIEKGRAVRRSPDVNFYPTQISTLAPNAQITIGDLHGNALGLIYYLAHEGIITLKDKDYEELVQIYNTKSTDSNEKWNANIQKFKDILNSINFFRTDVLVRLIGDELADRGENDFWTLLFLEKMIERGVPVEILISNHSREFIHAYETSKEFRYGLESVIDPRLMKSMINLDNLIQRKIVSIEGIIELINRTYKPVLKALSYTINSETKAITIYSHAAIGINTIEKIAIKLGVPFLDNDVLQLANTIDLINVEFQKYVQENRAHELFDSAALKLAASSKTSTPGLLSDKPFETLIWNRHYDIDFIERPIQKADYTLEFVHGHDNPYDAARQEYYGGKLLVKPDNVFCVDNSFGKSERRFPYVILRSEGEYQLVPPFKREVSIEATPADASMDLDAIQDEVYKLLSLSEECSAQIELTVKDESSARASILAAEAAAITENATALESILRTTVETSLKKIVSDESDARATIRAAEVAVFTENGAALKESILRTTTVEAFLKKIVADESSARAVIRAAEAAVFTENGTALKESILRTATVEASLKKIVADESDDCTVILAEEDTAYEMETPDPCDASRLEAAIYPLEPAKEYEARQIQEKIEEENLSKSKAVSILENLNFMRQEEKLLEKIRALSAEKKIAAGAFYQTLDELKQQFRKGSLTTEQFKEKYEQEIDKAITLFPDRGWKQVLCDVLNALIYALTLTASYRFFHYPIFSAPTETETLGENVKASLNQAG